MTSPSLLRNAIDVINLCGFVVGSMSFTIAIFYGLFWNMHYKNIDQSNKFAKAINTLYAEVKGHTQEIETLRKRLEGLQAAIDD
jgi:hypothetical protein